MFVLMDIEIIFKRPSSEELGFLDKIKSSLTRWYDVDDSEYRPTINSVLSKLNSASVRNIFEIHGYELIQAELDYLDYSRMEEYFKVYFYTIYQVSPFKLNVNTDGAIEKTVMSKSEQKALFSDDIGAILENGINKLQETLNGKEKKKHQSQIVVDEFSEDSDKSNLKNAMSLVGKSIQETFISEIVRASIGDPNIQIKLSEHGFRRLRDYNGI